MNEQPKLAVWKFVAPEFVFGPETRRMAGLYARNFGLRKALVVTDPGVMAAGWTADVVDSLEAEAISCAIFSTITPNPRADEVMAGAAFYERESCDGIVAVGGGSPMDAAKGIGIVATNARHILEFEGVDRIPIPGPPLICVPTTAGSSADVSQFMIITDSKQNNKIVIVSKVLVPDVSLIDPVTTSTMSPYLTACVGLDALTHAVEAFVSNAHSPITDLHALEAIRLIVPNLRGVLDNPSDLNFRTEMMRGSMEAGLAFSNASLGAIHAMSHALGGFSDLAHGECNAMLLGPVIAFNFAAAADRYRLIAPTLGLDLSGLSTDRQKTAFIDRMNQLRTQACVCHNLRECGVAKADVPELARKAMRDPCIVTNPRRPSQRDIEVLFEEAL